MNALIMSVQCAMCMERYFAEAAANLKQQLGLLNSEQIPLTTNYWWCNLGFVRWLDRHHHPLECCELSQQCWPPPASLGGLMRTSCQRARQSKAGSASQVLSLWSKAFAPSQGLWAEGQFDHSRGLGIYYWSCVLSEIFWAVISKLILDFVRWHYS